MEKELKWEKRNRVSKCERERRCGYVDWEIQGQGSKYMMIINRREDNKEGRRGKEASKTV